MRISDWSSDVCSSDLVVATFVGGARHRTRIAVDRGRSFGRGGSSRCGHRRRRGGGDRVRVERRRGHAAFDPVQAPVQVQVLGAIGRFELFVLALQLLELRAQCLQFVLDLGDLVEQVRSEEHTSELQSLMRTSYAVFSLKKKNKL